MATMKTKLLSLLVTAAVVVPLSAQNGPQDLGIEPSLIEQQMRGDIQTKQALAKLRDLTLVPGKAHDDRDEDWDIVRRLERARQDQSEDAMIQRMLRELYSEAPQADKPDRNSQEMKAHDQAPNSQRPTWFIGLNVEPLEPFIQEHLALESEVGVKVTRVLKGSPAAKLGIRLNDIIFKAGGKNISSLEDLKTAVERAGRGGKPLELEWIQKGKRKTASLQPKGPPQPKQIKSNDNPAKTGIERRMLEMSKQLDRQQQEIEALRRQVGELRRQRMMRNQRPGNEDDPKPRSR